MAKRKTRLPKRIVGYKVPRVLRRSSTTRFFMDTPIGREIVAEAVVAAAAAAATAMLKHRPSTAQLGADGAEMLRFGNLAVVRSSDAVEQALEALGGVVKGAVGSMKSGAF